MNLNRQILIIDLLIIISLLTGCAPGQLLAPTFTPASTSTRVPTAITTPSPIPTKTSTHTATPACVGTAGSWGTPPDVNTLSIMFTIQDCRIIAVFIMGYINGEFVTVSNEANEPINGSQFNLLYSFTDQDRYNMSGTFTSPTSASIQLVIFKGFRFTTGQPSTLKEDLTINATANP